MSEDVYSSIVAAENVNRADGGDGASARNVTEALSVLGVKDAGPEAEKHPEKWVVWGVLHMVMLQSGSAARVQHVVLGVGDVAQGLACHPRR